MCEGLFGLRSWRPITVQNGKSWSIPRRVNGWVGDFRPPQNMLAEFFLGWIAVGLLIVPVQVVGDCADQNIDKLNGLLDFGVLEFQFPIRPIRPVGVLASASVHDVARFVERLLRSAPKPT
jgi:hypothetical protein